MIPAFSFTALSAASLVANRTKQYPCVTNEHESQMFKRSLLEPLSEELNKNFKQGQDNKKVPQRKEKPSDRLFGL